MPPWRAMDWSMAAVPLERVATSAILLNRSIPAAESGHGSSRCQMPWRRPSPSSPSASSPNLGASSLSERQCRPSRSIHGMRPVRTRSMPGRYSALQASANAGQSTPSPSSFSVRAPYRTIDPRQSTTVPNTSKQRARTGPRRLLAEPSVGTVVDRDHSR